MSIPASPQKFAWPELVGVPATPAVTKIMQDRPDVAVEVLPPGAPLQNPGWNLERVRVFIDDNGLVATIPFVG